MAPAPPPISATAKNNSSRSLSLRLLALDGGVGGEESGELGGGGGLACLGVLVEVGLEGELLPAPAAVVLLLA